MAGSDLTANEAELLAAYRRLGDFDRSALLGAARGLLADGQRVRDAYQDYLDAGSFATPPPNLRGPEALKRWKQGQTLKQQKALLEILRCTSPLPSEVRQHIAYSLEEITAGFPSELLSPIPRYGGGKRPFVRKLRAVGIAYLAAVESGAIHDPHPTKTVADAYGVDRTTVQGWMRAAGDPPPILPNLMESYSVDKPNPWTDPKGIRLFLKAWGSVYQQLTPKTCKF